jgi:hypothetical protein
MATLTATFKETKDVIDFAIAVGKGYEISMDDGKLTWTDLPNLMEAVMKIGPALTGFGDIKLEFKMATKEEALELIEYVKENVELKNKTAEAFIEDAFALVVDLWHLINTYFLKANDVESGDSERVNESPEEPNTANGNPIGGGSNE